MTNNWRSILFFLVWTLVASFSLLEIALRIFGLYETLSEKVGREYHSFYQPCSDSWFLFDSLEKEYKDVKSEFSYTYKKNNMGLFTKEVSTGKHPDAKKILIIGDSFTQGIGAPQDSSWPAVLEMRLHQNGSNCVDVYNGGIGGSDPFFAYRLLSKKLMDYEWDEVFFVVNGTDISEYVGRGGLERFKENGETCYRKAPWFEFFYAHIRTARIILTFLGYDYTLLMKEESEKLKQEGVEKITEVLIASKEFCDSNNARFVVVVHPGAADYSHPTPIEGTFQVFDIVDPLVKNDIEVYDLRNGFKEVINMNNFEEYAWPIDGHLKSKGYALFADIVFKNYTKSRQNICKTEVISN